MASVAVQMPRRETSISGFTVRERTERSVHAQEKVLVHLYLD